LGCQEEDIFRTRKTEVGLRRLAKYRRRAGVLKERWLRRYVDNEKV